MTLRRPGINSERVIKSIGSPGLRSGGGTNQGFRAVRAGGRRVARASARSSADAASSNVLARKVQFPKYTWRRKRHLRSDSTTISSSGASSGREWTSSPGPALLPRQGRGHSADVQVREAFQKEEDVEPGNRGVLRDATNLMCPWQSPAHSPRRTVAGDHRRQGREPASMADESRCSRTSAGIRRLGPRRRAVGRIDGRMLITCAAIATKCVAPRAAFSKTIAPWPAFEPAGNDEGKRA